MKCSPSPKIAGHRLHCLALVIALFIIPFAISACATAEAIPKARAQSTANDATPQLRTPVSANDGVPQARAPVAANGDIRQIEDDAPKIATIDLTIPADDLWQRMRNGFSMPNLNSPLVADRQAWYLNRPDLFRTMAQRSRRYLYYIVTELEKRGMPTELALLPMVESSYNPRAHSSARALGIWQFIPSTGKNYGLEKNWYGDERRDIVASTNAALDYLQHIYEMHGDWHLALASYNWGEGAVGRAVAKNRARGLPADYSSLAMPGETRYYVPKLQALKNIIADPALFGITLDAIANRPYFGSIDKPATMDVTTASKLAEIPVEEFMALNPAYSRPIIPGSNDSPLILPTDKIAVFQTNLQQYQNADKPLSRWRTYTFKRGDKLATVAARNGLALAHLKQLNGINRNRVRPGTTLLIPDASAIENSSYLLASLPRTPVESSRTVKKRHGKHSARTAKRAKSRAHAGGKHAVRRAPKIKKRK